MLYILVYFDNNLPNELFEYKPENRLRITFATVGYFLVRKILQRGRNSLYAFKFEHPFKLGSSMLFYRDTIPTLFNELIDEWDLKKINESACYYEDPIDIYPRIGRMIPVYFLAVAYWNGKSLHRPIFEIDPVCTDKLNGIVNYYGKPHQYIPYVDRELFNLAYPLNAATYSMYSPYYDTNLLK